MTEGGLPLIAVVAWPGRSTTDIRLGLLARAAADAGLARFVFHSSGAALAFGADAARYDAVVVQRDVLVESEVPPLVSRVRHAGGRLVVELDDDMVSPEARQRLLGQDYTRPRLDGLQALLGEADRVVVSTDELARRVGRAAPGVPVAVWPNRLDPALWEARAAEPGPADPAGGTASAARETAQAAPGEVPAGRFGAASAAVRGGAARGLYFGTATHSGDLALIADLPGALAARGIDLTVDVVGVTAGELPPGFERLAVPDGRYEAFTRWLVGLARSGRWRAGLAPLAAEPFNDAKSDLKLLEYAALGLPAVASRRGPYRDAGALAVLVDDDAAGPDAAASGAAAWADAVTGALAGPGPLVAASAQALRGRLIDRQAAEAWVKLLVSADL
jgi:hypothetical protein